MHANKQLKAEVSSQVEKKQASHKTKWETKGPSLHRHYHWLGTCNKSQRQSRLSRSVFIPFKRGKIPTLSESYPLILYHCRMFLFILKFLQNCTQCMSLHGWFLATCFLLPPRSPRGQHAAFVASLDKYSVLPQKCPWWQIIHYSWLNEINTLCQSLSNTMTLRGKETPNPLCKPPDKQHQQTTPRHIVIFSPCMALPSRLGWV